MVTWEGYSIKFEHKVSKIHQISVNTWALISGEVSNGTRIAMNAAQDVARRSSSAAIKVEEAANLVADHYAQVRMEWAIAKSLTSRGLTLRDFYAGAAGPIADMINAELATFTIGVDLIVAGVDGSGGHLFVVTNPGIAVCQDVLGMAAVGIGDVHAVHSMIGFHHGPMDPLKDVLFRVFASKRRADLAPGVGHETDLSIVSSSGARHLSPSTLAELDRIYSEVNAASVTCLAEEMGKLTLEFVTNGGADTTESEPPGAD